MSVISNLVIRRDQRTATAVWLENHEKGRHQNFPSGMSDAEIKAAILGDSERCETDGYGMERIADAEGGAVAEPTDTEESEPKRNSRIQMRKDKRKLKAEYLRELKKNGIDLSAERSFGKIEAAYMKIAGKNEKQ